VLTPQQYAKGIANAFKKKYPTTVTDLWVVPDYDALLKPYMDQKFERYAKAKWTQLQFRFEAVPLSEDFPLGVKTTYRRYAQDKVIEIKQNVAAGCGFSEEYCDVSWFPAAKEAENGLPARPEGMFLLKHLPDKESIKPKGFKDGSYAELCATLKKVKTELPPDAVNEWMEFAKCAPTCDDVGVYLDENPQAL